MKDKDYYKSDRFNIFDEFIPVSRIIIIIIFVTIFILLRKISLNLSDAVNITLLMYFAYALLLLIFPKVRKHVASRWPFLLTMADTVLISLIIALTGGSESPFYIFYIMVIAIMAISYGLKYSVICSIICSISYLSVVLTINSAISYDVFIILLFFQLFAVFIGLTDETIHKSFYTMISQDSLTSLYNYQYFYKSLDNHIEKGKKHSEPVSLAVIDVDNFKIYNDKFGHLKGDRVLISIASIIKSCIRQEDIPARYGGDEFVIIFPSTDGRDADTICERIKEKVGKILVADQKDRITLSVGIASFPADGRTSAELFDSADTMLYESKQSGKNKVLHK